MNIRKFRAGVQGFNVVNKRTFIFKALMPQAPVDSRVDLPIRVTELGDKIIYESDQRHQIRLMMGSGALNLLYWSYHLSNCYFYKDVVVNGIELGGNPMWGYVGLSVSALIAVTTRAYSHHTVYNAYTTADGLRVGFQMHNIFGFPGRKIEAKPGNIKIGETSKTRSSLIPLQIVGIDKNVLVDKSGVFLGDRIFEKVLIERQIPPGFSAQGTAAPTDPATDAPLAVAEAVKEAHISKRFHRRVHKVQR